MYAPEYEAAMRPRRTSWGTGRHSPGTEMHALSDGGVRQGRNWCIMGEEGKDRPEVALGCSIGSSMG